MKYKIKFKVYTTDSAIFLTREKIASRYFAEILDVDPCEVTILSDFSNISYIDEYSSEDRKEKSIPAFFDLIDVLDGKIDKDIVLLYRNPDKKIKSGILQDAFNLFLIKERKPEESVLVNYMMQGYSNTDEIIEALDIVNSQIGQARTDKNEKELRDFLKKFIWSFLKSASFINFQTTHCINFLYEYYYFITQEKIKDLNLVLFDIDSDKPKLSDILNHYKINVPEVDMKKHSNKIFMDILDEILEEDIDIKTQLGFTLDIDQFFYKAIKDNKLNFKLNEK